MQVRRGHTFLAALLLCCTLGCDRSQPGEPEREPVKPHLFTSEPTAPGDPPELPEHARPLALQMKRKEAIQASGSCLERVNLLPATGDGTLSVETLQPRVGPCRDFYGAHRYRFVGGVLVEITPGVDELPQP